MTNQLDSDSKEQWVDDVRKYLGLDAFNYLLGSNLELGQSNTDFASELSDEQLIVLEVLSKSIHDTIERYDKNGQEITTELISQTLSMQLCYTQCDSDVTWGYSLYLQTHPDEISEPKEYDDINQLLSSLVIRVYQNLLISPESDISFSRNKYLSVSASTTQNPLNKQFCKVFLEKQLMPSLFTGTDPDVPSKTVLDLLSHSFAGIQLMSIPDTCIIAGWRLARLEEESSDPSLGTVIEQTSKAFEMFTKSMSNNPKNTVWLMGVSGVLLPTSMNEFKLDWVKVRSFRDSDREYATFYGGFSDVISEIDNGQEIKLHNYGDAVVEFQIPFKLRVLNPDTDTAIFYNEYKTFRERYLEEIQLALILATSDNPSVVRFPWSCAISPLQVIPSIQANSGISGSSGTIQLTEEQMMDWKYWCQKLHESSWDNIHIAIKRIISAVESRTDPTDRLIDTITCWENLVGSKTETTFKVTAALAWLLEPNSKQRKELLKQCKDLYNKRSLLVHGNSSKRITSDKVNQASLDAIQIAVKALKILFESRQDLLKLDSEKRAENLIMQYGER